MSEKIIVSVKEGKVRGVKQKSRFSGVEYYSFFGIPYAQPPEGRLRFRDPVKAKPWKEVYDATQEKEGCFQYSFALLQYLGTEDCLYTNVYTCKLPTKGEPLKPVIVLIHPGAFFYGSPNSMQFGSPDFFIHNDIVYVGISYRLHIFGFLNLGLEECSGNQGLKDIIMGLRWIKENIRSFNGDPNNVTLLGSSSAAYAIHILMLSPQAEGLFHKAVMMGLHLFSNTVVAEICSKEMAFELVRPLGFQGNDPKKLLEFLRKQSALQLTYYMKGFRNTRMDQAPVYPIVVFKPEGEDREDGILWKEARKRISFTMKIPLMFGLCENETVMGFSDKLRQKTLKNYRMCYRQDMFGWMRNLSNDDLNEINNQIDSFYLKNHSADNIPEQIIVNILTDVTFSELYESLIDVISTELPESVYVYKFEHQGSLITLENFIATDIREQIKGSYHGTDFCYWACSSEPRTSEVADVVRKFTKLICTFAKNGDPNYEGIEEPWKPTTPQNPCHMRINSTLKMADGKLNDERMEFWHKIMKQFKKD